MFWVISADGNPHGYRLFRRHYSAKKNKKPKQRQFVGPGERIVLIGWFCDAIFVWRKQAFRKDGQAGVNCSIFRNESDHLSSEMIREAMDIAWQRWPGERLFTMIDAKAIRSRNPGYCFIKAGWRKSGTTKKGLLIFEAFDRRSGSSPT